jgi:hypothetical protein
MIGYVFNFVLSITVLMLGFAIIRNWVPALFTVLKRTGSLIIKLSGTLLMQKRERRGGATIRSHRLRWRP